MNEYEKSIELCPGGCGSPKKPYFFGTDNLGIERCFHIINNHPPEICSGTITRASSPIMMDDLVTNGDTPLAPPRPKIQQIAHKTSSGLKDSGTRTEYETGATREVRDPLKGRYDLIPALSHHRLAVHYARGAVKYAPRNWEKGLPLSTYIDSAERHLNNFKGGDRGEDHMAAIAWNVYCYMWTEQEIAAGRLPKELDDGNYVK